VKDVTVASMEQSSDAGQITNAMNQLNQITQQNASSSEELTSTAEEMSSHAKQLQQLIAFFRVNDYGRAVACSKPNAKNMSKASDAQTRHSGDSFLARTTKVVSEEESVTSA
jgi:methyl-accepting chemotaxis protein